MKRSRRHAPNPPTVRPIITNKNFEVLLVQRSTDCKTNGGLWEIPGGTPDIKEATQLLETPEETAIREAREEVGIEIRLTGGAEFFRYQRTFESQRGKIVNHSTVFLLADALQTNIVITQPKEVMDADWFMLDETYELAMTDASAAARNKYAMETQWIETPLHKLAQAALLS